MLKRGKANYYNKKGISPVVSAVLLVAFAVGLGALIMNWSQGIVTEKSDSAKVESELHVSCQISTSLSIKTVAGSKRICYKNTSASDGILEFTLENKGSDTISGVKVVMIGENDTSTVEDIKDLEILGGNIQKSSANFNFTSFGQTVVQADFIPFVMIDAAAGPQLCKNVRIEEDGIFECD